MVCELCLTPTVSKLLMTTWVTTFVNIPHKHQYWQYDLPGIHEGKRDKSCYFLGYPTTSQSQPHKVSCINHKLWDTPCQGKYSEALTKGTIHRQFTKFGGGNSWDTQPAHHPNHVGFVFYYISWMTGEWLGCVPCSTWAGSIHRSMMDTKTGVRSRVRLITRWRWTKRIPMSKEKRVGLIIITSHYFTGQDTLSGVRSGS